MFPVDYLCRVVWSDFVHTNENMSGC